MAMKARSALMMNSVPGIGLRRSSTWQHFTPVSTPSSSPTNSSVPTWNSRTAPSACEEEVRIFVAQKGQTASLSSFSGGCGRMSSWVTFTAPWRKAVPTQSDAVSPPPTTTMCLPPARIGSDGQPTLSMFSRPTRRFCCTR